MTKQDALKKFLAFIARGTFDEHLERISTELNARRRVIRYNYEREMLRELEVDDHVRIKDIKPKYLAGHTGTVKTIVDHRGKTYFGVALDLPDRRGRVQVTVPPSCLEKI